MQKFWATLPREKINKAVFILSDPEFDPGLQGLKVITVQWLRGNMQFWVVVASSIRTEFKAVDGVLGLVQEGEGLVFPRKAGEEGQRRVQAFEEAVELLRLAVSLPETWSSTFS